MFYSHEILTSPEHGVATIWLVATLGSRSISRRLNRKAILDVDVPKACNVISDPQAPMALRLQGNLLYGVSRVYNQQCGYTLTDVQSMHDRMKATVPSMLGGAIDPMAGKIRPDHLILPYDPSFIPEHDLPGLGLDLSKLTLSLSSDMDIDIEPWAATPDLSQSALSNTTVSPASLQLSFGSSDVVMQDAGIGNFETADLASSHKSNLRRIAATALQDGEEGVLLQPDFEFDEDGNIIELDRGDQGSELSRQQYHSPDELMQGMPDEVNMNDIDMVDFQRTPITTTARARDHTPTPAALPRQTTTSRLNGLEIPTANTPTTNRTAPMPQTRKRGRPKTMEVNFFDEQTELRNSELGYFNNNYVVNMASILRKMGRNREAAQAKQNAAAWVYGRGIGNVGNSPSHMNPHLHPLGGFAGEKLFELVDLYGIGKRRRKRGLPCMKKACDEEDEEEGSGSESGGRRVRAREEVEAHVGRGNDEEVELARHASSVLRDDTTQMPWNITASIQSSRHGSSTAGITANNTILRGMGLTMSGGIGMSIGSVSDFSSRDVLESTVLGRPRSRLTSASPLAGRGFPYDINSLSIPGNDIENDEVDVLGDFDLSQYLQEELYTAGQAISQTQNDLYESLASRVESSTLDQESQNFLRFLVENTTGHKDADAGEDPFVAASAIQQAARSGETSFSELLPVQRTSRTVATHGLMHVLTLATKGFLTVRQEAYTHVNSALGAKYDYGEIFVRLSVV